MNRTCLLALAACLLPSVCRAQQPPAVSFPLEGRYRPGKYMPVRVTLPAAARLSADGAVTTELEPSAAAATDAILPWLVIGQSPRNASWSAPGAAPVPLSVNLRPLNEGERLVGLAGAEPGAARPLFRFARVVPVRLDPTDPLPGPLAAWESLDGLLLDGTAVPWLTERRLAGLLAAGTTVAVRTVDRPGGDWPWERQENYWVVRAELAGPRGAVSADAYAPTEAWSPGWSDSFRRQAVLGAVLFALLALGASLWRSRYAVLAVVGLSIAATAGLALWRARQPSTAVASGAVVFTRDARVQVDDWTYFKAIAPARETTPWPDAPAVFRPVFFSSRQVPQTGIRLVVTPDGSPRHFVWEMSPGSSVAFLHRTAPAGPWRGTTSLPVTSPMREVARSLYVRTGTGFVGQSSDVTAASRTSEVSGIARWPAVVLSDQDEGRNRPRSNPHATSFPVAGTARAARPR